MSWLDESSHYSRSIQITHGDILVHEKNDWSQVGGRISKSQNKFMERGLESRIKDAKIKPIDGKWQEHYKDIHYSDDLILVANTNTVPYTPFSYIPYILVSYVNEVLHMSPATEYLWMRIIGFLFFLLLIILAIRITPIGKFPLALLTLVPTTILSAVSVTSDGFNIAMSYLFFAYLASLYFKLRRGDQEITIIDLLGISIISLLMAWVKLPAFLFLILFIPLFIWAIIHRKVSKEQIVFLSLLVVVTLFMLFWWYTKVSVVNTGAYFEKNVDTFKQLEFIAQDIPRFLRLLFNTIFHYNFFVFQLAYSNGWKPEYMHIPQMAVILYFIGLLIALFIKGHASESPKHVTKKDKNLVIALESTRVFTIIMFVIAVFMLLYLQYTDIGLLQIDGVQERYFIPLYFALASIPTREFLNKNWNYLAFILGLVPVIYYISFIINQL